MATLINLFGKPIEPSKPNKSWWKRFSDWYKINTVPKTVAWILPLLAFFGITKSDDISKLFEKSNPPNSVEFIQNFDFKILILPTQNFDDCPGRDTQFERTIETRLSDINDEEELGLQVLFDTTQSSPRNFADARTIGSKKGADLVIWGDYYETCGPESQACLKYVVVKEELNIEEAKGKSSIESFKSLANIMQGQLQRDIDYVIHWMLGVQAINNRQCEVAKVKFEKLAQDYPEKERDIYLMLANCFLLGEEYQPASDYFTKFLSIDSIHEQNYYNEGRIKHYGGDFKGATLDYTKALQDSANDASAYYNRAMSKFYQDDFSGAIADLDISIALESTKEDAYLNRGSAKYYLEDYDGAIVDYKAAIALKPKDPSGYNNLGAAYFSKGNWVKAIESYTKAIELDYDRYDFYFNRGLAKKEHENLIGAVHDFKIALNFNPNAPEVIENLELVQEQLKEQVISANHH